MSKLLEVSSKDFSFSSLVSDAFVATAVYGNTNILQWLFDNGFSVKTSKICNEAAKHGNVNFLQLARSYGCGWTKAVCNQAIRNRHEHILRWARRNGCRWDADIKKSAFRVFGYTDDYDDDEQPTKGRKRSRTNKLAPKKQKKILKVERNDKK